MACSTFKVSPRLSVLCFKREGSNDPYFVVREFDTKVIRSPSQHKKGRGPSEQAIRASIRQAILNMSLKSERASKMEIRQLKAQGILGKRAPSCSLLCADDMLRLLEAFGKHSCARELRIALKKENNFSPLPMRSEEVRPRKRRHRSTTTASKRKCVNHDTARLDALLCALAATEDMQSREFKRFYVKREKTTSKHTTHTPTTPAVVEKTAEPDFDRYRGYESMSPYHSPHHFDRSPSRSPSPDTEAYQKTPEENHVADPPAPNTKTGKEHYDQAFTNSVAQFAYTRPYTAYARYVPPTQPNSEILPSSHVLMQGNAFV